MSLDTKFGRFQVAEAPSAVHRMHFYDGATRLKPVDWEPKNGVLDQEDLIAQGIDTAKLVKGAQKVDALGSCTANATSSGVTVPNFTGLVVRRCAALKISAYCISPRPIGPTIFGMTRASR